MKVRIQEPIPGRYVRPSGNPFCSRFPDENGFPGIRGTRPAGRAPSWCRSNGPRPARCAGPDRSSTGGLRIRSGVDSVRGIGPLLPAATRAGCGAIVRAGARRKEYPDE